jgi:hypothetical protein
MFVQSVESAGRSEPPGGMRDMPHMTATTVLKPLVSGSRSSEHRRSDSDAHHTT